MNNNSDNYDDTVNTIEYAVGRVVFLPILAFCIFICLFPYIVLYPKAFVICYTLFATVGLWIPVVIVVVGVPVYILWTVGLFVYVFIDELIKLKKSN